MEHTLSFMVGVIFAATLISIATIIGLKINQGIEKIDVEGSWIQISKNIKKIVDNVYVQAEGSSIKFKPSLSSQQILCFLNRDNPINNDLTEDDKRFIQYLKNEWSGEKFPNVYYRDSKLKKYTYVEYLNPSQTLCLNTTHNLVYFENKGTYVDVMR